MRKLLCVTPLFPSDDKPFYCIYLQQQLQALSKYEYDITVLIPVLSNRFSKQERVVDNLRIVRVEYKSLKGDFKYYIEQDVNNNKYDILALNLCSQKLIQLFAKYVGIPKVVHFHGLNVWEDYHIKYQLYEKIIKYKKIRTLKKITAVVGVSEKVKRIVSEHYPVKRIFTVYNGVNPELFFPRSKRQKESFDIYCIANLIRIKGHEYLIKALATVKEVMPNKITRVHLIGDGPLKSELFELSKINNVEDCVLFEGEMMYDDIAMKMSTECDMFVMPSYFESLGCVYLEAMACEIPTVGVSGCGIDEIIIDGINGFLVEPHNANQIADKIIWALNNPQELRSIAKEGRNTVINKFTWDESGKKLANTYEEIIRNYE